MRDVIRSKNPCKRRFPHHPPAAAPNSSWGGVNYNQISFQWWSEKKLEFGGEGKKKNSYNLCLSPQGVNFIILQGKFSLEKSGGRAGVGWC